MSDSDYPGSPVVDRVVSLVLPILADLGMELYDCEHTGGIMRVTVSKQGGFDLEDIALVTRLLSKELDQHDPVPGRYTLEVSSPGLERHLRRPAHYLGAIGSTVSVRLRTPVEGARRVHGTLVAADDDGIVVRLDDAALTEQQLRYDQIDRARTVFVWGPAPKPGGKKPGEKKPGKRTAGRVSDAGSDTDSPTTTQEAGAS